MKKWRPERLSNLSKIAQLWSNGFDPSNLVTESLLLIMTLCNLLEPELGNLSNSQENSDGIEGVGGESAWDKC